MSLSAAAQRRASPGVGGGTVLHAVRALYRREAHKSHSSNQAIKLSKITNILTVIVRYETSIEDTRQSVLNYARWFEEDDAVRFVTARVLDTVDDIISSNFLAANSKPTYPRYIFISKMMIKKGDILPLLVSLFMDALVLETLGIKHLDDPGINILTDEDILFMIWATDSDVKNDHKAILFHACAIYHHARALHDILYSRHMKQGEEKLPILALFSRERFSRQGTSLIK